MSVAHRGSFSLLKLRNCCIAEIMKYKITQKQNLTLNQAIKLLVGIICIAISIAYFVDPTFTKSREFISLFCIISSIYLTIYVRNNIVLFIIFAIICYANYSACLMNTNPPYYGYETLYSNDSLSILGMSILLLFNGALCLILPHKIINFKLPDILKQGNYKYSLVLTIAISILLVLIFFTCSSGFSSVGGRADNNSIFEYAYILFIIGFVLSGHSFAQKSILTLVAVLYVAQALVGGNRASVLAVALLLVVVFAGEKLSWFKILPWLAIGIVAMQALGYYRSGDDFFLFKIGEALDTTVENGLNWDTASYAFHQSIAFLRLDEIISVDEKMYLLGQWITSWLFGSALIPDSSLTVYCQQLFPGMGGGFLPLYFYFYLGIPGVIISALIIGYWIRAINNFAVGQSSVKNILALGVAVTFCRWYLYSPSPLTTGCVFLLIAYNVVAVFSNTGNPRHNITDRNYLNILSNKYGVNSADSNE